MNPTKLVAVVLIVAGVLGLAYGSFSYTQNTTVAKVGAPPGFSFRLDDYRPEPVSPMAQMLTMKSTIRVDDYAATEGYAQRNPAMVALVEQGRGRSAMQVPMLREDEVVGAMTIYRPEVRPSWPRVERSNSAPSWPSHWSCWWWWCSWSRANAASR